MLKISYRLNGKVTIIHLIIGLMNQIFMKLANVFSKPNKSHNK